MTVSMQGSLHLIIKILDTKINFMSCFIVAIVEFSESVYEFREDDASTEICIVLTNNVTIETNLQVRVQTEEGTTNGSDFQGIDEENMMINGPRTCFTVQGIGTDGLVEPTEMFTVSLESLNPSRLMLSSPTEVTVVIMDSDSESVIKLRCSGA